MWISIETSRQNPTDSWIAGVFKEQPDALEHLSHPLQELRQIPAEDYPVLFMNGSIDLTCDELAEKLFSMEKKEEEDHCILTVFLKDYRGYKEEMEDIKMTEHYHIDNAKIIHLLEISLRTPSGLMACLYQCRNCGRTAKSAMTRLRQDGKLPF